MRAEFLEGEDFAMDGDVPDAALASSTLELARIAGDKAERLLAAIWRILEARSLPTPIMEVDCTNGLFDISLTFGSARERVLLESSLPNNTH